MSDSPVQSTDPEVQARADLGLGELLRMMDVATALRRERERAAAELAIDDVKAALRTRLRDTADATGEPVTDAEIEVAIEQYFERQHEFRPADRGLRRLIAWTWVKRRPIAWITGTTLALFFGVWWLSTSASSPVSSEGRRARALAAAVAEADAAEDHIAEFAASDAAKARVAELQAALTRARAADDPAAIQAAAAPLRALRAQLLEEFEVRIVRRPGERSGIDTYDRNGNLSGYYLIVEAITKDGRVLSRAIRNAEVDRVDTVKRWAEQVPAEVYERIKRDKLADGIVDESLFARKRRGHLELDIAMPGPDGKTPLARGRQITKW